MLIRSTVIPVLFAALALTGPALAAPTAAQKDEFYAVCMGISGDAAL